MAPRSPMELEGSRNVNLKEDNAGSNTPPPKASILSVNLGPARMAQSVLGGGPMSERVPYGSVAGAAGASMLGITINMVTSIIGLGVTSMAPVWEKGGLLTSVIFLILGSFSSWGASYLNTFNVDLAGGAEDNAQIGQVVGGKGLSAFCGFCAAMQLMGSAAAYALLTPTQLTQLFKELDWNVPIFRFDESNAHDKNCAIVWWFIILAAPTVFLKDMAYLAKGSIIGVIGIIIFFFAAIFGLIFSDAFYLVKAVYPLPENNNGLDPTSLEAYQYYEPQYVAKLAYGYIAILNKFAFGFAVANMVPTMKKDMANPAEAGMSITLAHVIVTASYAFISVLAILSVGAGIKCTSFIMEILSGGYRIAAATGVIMNLFISYPLMMNPVLQMTERIFGIDKLKGGLGWVLLIINRLVLMGLTMAFVFSGGNVLVIQDLTTAIFVSLNTAFFPPVFYWRLCNKIGAGMGGAWVAVSAVTLFWFTLIFFIGGYSAMKPFIGDVPFFDQFYLVEPGCNPDRSRCIELMCID